MHPPVHGGAEEADSDSEDEATDDVEPPKVLGDLLESLAGAVFMDSGMNLQAVWDTLGVLFTEKIGMCLDTEKIIIINKNKCLHRCPACYSGTYKSYME